MANPSNAGPYDIGVDEILSPNETIEYQLAEVKAGPTNKKGYLRKLFGEKGGLDYLFVVNTSGELIKVETAGGQTIVPPATSQNLSNGPYQQLTVTNMGGVDVNTGSGDDIAIEVGNVTREEKKFSARDALNDSIPGLQL